MSIYIGKPVVVSDMQGPCPEGFHVPTRDEANTLISAMSALGYSSVDNWMSILHLPKLASRVYDSSIGYANGRYWTCINYNQSTAYILTLQGSNTSVGTYYKGYGLAIRPFKDTAVTPDSSWTLINTGVYWNTTDGIISIQNGSGWITIADKNVGATTVYNNGDNLSESNCGKLFQRGNNNGFPYTGTVTTSSTQVNASTYGPSNPYSSSTFITNSNSYWDSSNNGNLRGGVTQQSGTVFTEKDIKNIYVWVDIQQREPGANTLAYFPFKTDQLDATGNYTLTANGTQQTIGYKFNVQCTVTGGQIPGINFIGMWYNAHSTISGNYDLCATAKHGYIAYNPGHTRADINNKVVLFSDSSYTLGATANGMSYDAWHYQAWSYDGSKILLCQDGVVTTFYNGSGYDFGNGFTLNNYGTYGNPNYQRTTFSDLIIENTGWTAQDMINYYELTKSNYGQ